MNFMNEIRNELLNNVIVVVDRYETGEILFEGPLCASEKWYCLVADALDGDSIEFSDTQWVEGRNGERVAALSVWLTDEQASALAEYLKAQRAYMEWSTTPLGPDTDLEQDRVKGERLDAEFTAAWSRWRELKR